MSRSITAPMTTTEDPLRRWNGTPREFRFALTYETGELVEFDVHDGKWRGKPDGSTQGFSLSSDYHFDDVDLENCIVERVTCSLVGGPESVVFMCPSVEVFLGSDRKRLEPSVRNAPCGCPLYDRSDKGTVVHEWNLTPADLKRCEKFGKFTSANLAKLGAKCVHDGDCVTLPDSLGGLVAEEHARHGLGVTERGQTNAVDREEYERLVPIFLEAVSDVRARFHDLREISVKLNIDPTCEKETLIEGETVTLIVCVHAWCETKVNGMK